MSKYRALRVYQLTPGKTTIHSITNSVRLSSRRPNSGKKAREDVDTRRIRGGSDGISTAQCLGGVPPRMGICENSRRLRPCTDTTGTRRERTLPTTSKSVLIFQPDICVCQFAVIHEFLHAPVPLQNVRQCGEQTAFNLFPVREESQRLSFDRSGIQA